MIALFTPRAHAATWEDFFAYRDVRPLSREYRVALATSINELFDPLRRAIPPLSDTDQEWLRKYDARLTRLDSDSDEYTVALTDYLKATPAQKKTAIHGLTVISDAASCIVSRADREMSCWAQLSAALMDDQVFGAIYRLHESQSIRIDDARTKRLFIETLGVEIYGGLGQRVLSDILLPNLTARGL